jgi:hypothetical protein
MASTQVISSILSMVRDKINLKSVTLRRRRATIVPCAGPERHIYPHSPARSRRRPLPAPLPTPSPLSAPASAHLPLGSWVSCDPCGLGARLSTAALSSPGSILAADSRALGRGIYAAKGPARPFSCSGSLSDAGRWLDSQDVAGCTNSVSRHQLLLLRDALVSILV